MCGPDYEWKAIGKPDLTEAGKEAALVSWQLAPAMQVNPAFVDDLRAAGVTEAEHVYFICRSGVRSVAAAQAAEAAGFTHAYNVTNGFEGPPDGQGTRGRLAGWQADGPGLDEGLAHAAG